MSPILKARLMLWGTVLVVLIVVGTVLYFALRAPVSVSRLATRFCECTEDATVKSSPLEYSNDDFKYRVGMNACVGEEFAANTERMTEDERYYYLEQIQALVAEKCPMQLSNVFAPIPRPPRPPRDSSLAN